LQAHALLVSAQRLTICMAIMAIIISLYIIIIVQLPFHVQLYDPNPVRAQPLARQFLLAKHAIMTQQHLSTIVLFMDNVAPAHASYHSSLARNRAKHRQYLSNFLFSIHISKPFLTARSWHRDRLGRYSADQRTHPRAACPLSLCCWGRIPGVLCV
jgi:hypothetical protein